MPISFVIEGEAQTDMFHHILDYAHSIGNRSCCREGPNNLSFPRAPKTQIEFLKLKLSFLKLKLSFPNSNPDSNPNSNSNSN